MSINSVNSTTDTGFEDPYKEAEQDDKSRLTTWLPDSDRMFLLAVRPMRGTVQTTINMLLKGLIDECKRRNIRTWEDSTRFEQLVAERSSISRPIDPQGTETPERNDGSGVAGVHQSPPTGEGQRPDVPRRSRPKRPPVAEDNSSQGNVVGPK